MVNEYGAKLDRNGYAPSIIQDEADESCFICYANGYYLSLIHISEPTRH